MWSSSIPDVLVFYSHSSYLIFLLLGTSIFHGYRILVLKGPVQSTYYRLLVQILVWSTYYSLLVRILSTGMDNEISDVGIFNKKFISSLVLKHRHSSYYFRINITGIQY